jgi:hypothetical protein
VKIAYYWHGSACRLTLLGRGPHFSLSLESGMLVNNDRSAKRTWMLATKIIYS